MNGQFSWVLLFTRLDNVILQSGAKTLFFDELQLVEGWEMYVRQKLDEGFKVIITGSNASLLSKELGTKLIGRHITQELFPFVNLTSDLCQRSHNYIIFIFIDTFFIKNLFFYRSNV